MAKALSIWLIMERTRPSRFFILVSLFLTFEYAHTFIAPSPFLSRISPLKQNDFESALHKLNSQSDDSEDWRDFRARLVMQERRETESDGSCTSSSESSSWAWAYETGQNIEKGSIILSRCQPIDNQGSLESGLSQQYFHKSIILVLGKSGSEMYVSC